MTVDRQTQKSGDNSQLMQAGTINIYNGIDEKRAREICEETFAIVRKDFTYDAYACANERVEQFEDVLIPKMVVVEDALNAFSDPAFQFLLASAQRTAAATERYSDYNMLSELLMCRITKGATRKSRAGISRAVEIIDQIDDDALCALTIIHAINTFIPESPICKVGIRVLANLYEKLIYMELPSGIDWIEHLDILDAVRINHVASFKKMNEYFSERFSGYFSAGIKKDSDDYKKALEILYDAGLSPLNLVTNDLLEGYVLLPVINKEEIRRVVIDRNVVVNGVPSLKSNKINDKEIMAFEAVWNLYSTEENVKKEVVSAFMKEWDSYPSLKKLHIWFDSLTLAFDITHVGRVLAHTNACCRDKTIPELALPV